jgi:hypothetical protein
VSELEPAPGWKVRTDVRHDRLVWLAARPHLQQLHRKWWHSWTRILRASDAPRRTMWIDRENSETDDMSASMQRAAVIVDGLAGRFSPHEREVVRRTGLLPEWFWPAYLAEFDAPSRR